VRDRVIVSCCYSEDPRGRDYRFFLERLERSLDEFGKDADRLFWQKEFPPGSPPHMGIPYAFKYYAVKEAFRRGYRYVMWLDAGTQAIASIEVLWERIVECGYALLLGTDSLGKWISDYALKHFDYTRERAKEMKLAGGCLVGLDSQNAKAMEFFKIWGEIVKDRKLMMGANRKPVSVGGAMRSLMLSDADESIVSMDPFVDGHRSDESCFSLIMDKLSMKPITYYDWTKICITY
jgi:hypothetical protein